MTPLEATRDALVRTGASKFLVAVSGGKDSLATLDACVRFAGAENVTGFLMVLVAGLEVEWRPIRAVEKRFGIKVLSVPHYELSAYLRNNVLRPYTPGCEKIKVLKQVDVERHVRKLTGIEWTAWGERAADSIYRNAKLKRIKGVDEPGRRVFPIWTWKKPDVGGYLHARKIVIPRITGGGVFGGGVTLTPKCLAWLKKHEPADFKKILKVFPLAEGLLIREEIRSRQVERARAGEERREALAVPEVRGA